MAVKQGMKEKGWLEFKYPPTGEPIRFPVGTVHGSADGPTLTVLGGMHGSEYAGIEAAIRLFNQVDPAKLCGTLKVGMIYNLPAFYNNLGFVVPQDGKNPGRVFPGRLDGTYSEVMAFYFMENFLTHSDYYIELHGGDIPEALIPFVSVPLVGDEKVDSANRGLAMVYNIPIIASRKVNDPANPPRSAYGVMAMQGTPAILCESGQQGILKLEEAETHLVGLRNILIHLGMLSGPIVNTVKRSFSEEHLALRSEHIGMWYPCVKLGEWVKQDQVVGHIRDYFGQDIAPVKAVFDGLVTVIRTSPAVGIGNVVLEHDRITGREE
jgi:predicted deacylase